MLRLRLCARQIRIALAGALVCGALPGVAHAQQTTTTKTTQTNAPIDGNNPCVAGEHFSGTGTLTTREEDSPNKSKFRSQLQGQALNDPRTAKYNVLEFSEREFITTARTTKFEFEDRNHFIREGKTKSAPTKLDDFFERSRTTIINGQVTRDELRFECK
jgi:hypothetical protein